MHLGPHDATMSHALPLVQLLHWLHVCAICITYTTMHVDNKVSKAHQ